MGLIKGITIKLTEADGTEAQIANVLPTPSNATQDQQAEWNLGAIRPDYAISIPKDDAHAWLGGRAEFFGEKWEVVALSGKSIDALTPLAWNRRAYVIREMSDKVTLRTMRTRTRAESGIFRDEYREVEIDALAHPMLLESNYEGDRDGSKLTRTIIVRQADFDGAAVTTEETTREPKHATLDGRKYVIDHYRRIGEVVMALVLVAEA